MPERTRPAPDTVPLPGRPRARSAATQRAGSGDDPLIGRIVEKQYRLLSRIGEGGMGAVYEAEQLGTGRRYAVKTLLPKWGVGGVSASRFEREAVASSFLKHPNIVEVEALGRLPDGTLYLVMELARGKLVSELIAARLTPARRALVIARQVLEAIGYAHIMGMIHRDLKPENIMVVRAGAPGAEFDRIKLLDFGLVKLVGDLAEVVGAEKLTSTGMVFGTPAYMAPEQALGRTVDSRTDLYAVGVILFEMLAGRRPFNSDSPMQVMRMQASEPPPSLAEAGMQPQWCTPAIQSLVARALAKNPDERFASAAAMTAALDEAFLSIDHLPNPAQP